jgi:F-type H+-transporting ATPase subunit epsilon
MHLEIITPDRKLFEEEVKSVILPGIDGSFGVLDNHAPLIAALKKGIVNVIDLNSARHNFDIKGGVVEILANRIIVLAE